MGEFSGSGLLTMVVGMEPTGVQQAYAEVAGLYIDVFGSGEHEHPNDLDLIGRGLAHLPGLVLDLGCGPGHLTQHLSDHGAQVLGIDLVPEFVRHARGAHPDLDFVVGSITGLDLEDSSASGALCWYSLIHCEPEELTAALVEIRRVLAPGGALILGFFTGEAIEPFVHKVTTAFRWPMADMTQRLSEAGFVVTEQLQRGQRGARRPHGAIVARMLGGSSVGESLMTSR